MKVLLRPAGGYKNQQLAAVSRYSQPEAVELRPQPAPSTKFKLRWNSIFPKNLSCPIKINQF